MEPTPELMEGHAAAMETRRRRLAAAAAGLDLGQKRQAELPLDFIHWRADRWDVEWGWKLKGLWIAGGHLNPWTPHDRYLNCRTEAIARNACRTLRQRFPSKRFRYRPVRWVDARGNRFPEPS